MDCILTTSLINVYYTYTSTVGSNKILRTTNECVVSLAKSTNEPFYPGRSILVRMLSKHYLVAIEVLVVLTNHNGHCTPSQQQSDCIISHNRTHQQ